MKRRNFISEIYLSHPSYSWQQLSIYTIPVLKDIAVLRFNLTVPSRIKRLDLVAMIESAQSSPVDNSIPDDSQYDTEIPSPDGIDEEETAIAVVTQNEIISLPISIEAYGQVTEQKWQECLEANIRCLTGHGYVQKFEFNRGTDSHVLLFSHPDLKFHAISSRGDIQAFDEDNNDIDIESINVWEILESLD